MPQILVENLVKTFKVAERSPGLIGSIGGLFHRRYRTVSALDGVSFSVERGEIIGYIGPNGAGKSTTVKILSGILVPDSGRAEVFGLTPWKDRIETVRQIGVIFGQRTQLWWHLPVIESFELLRDIYKVPESDYRQSLDELVNMLGITDLLSTPVRQLSLGQRMRCDLAACLLHRPGLVFLDEPTIGLDAESKLSLREFILKLNRERGVTVVLTTHDMDDIEALCERVLVISQGLVFLDGTLDELRARVTSERRLTVYLRDENGEVSDPEAEVVSSRKGRVVLRFDPERTPAADLIARITAGHEVRDLMVENPPIEVIVSRLYRENGS